MDRPGVAAAAFNNAAWCDAVCRAHGHPGEFSGSFWLNRAEVPRFYPNVVTLLPQGAEQQADVISRLTLPGHWAIKDSFACLELASRGFTELFSAQWIRLTTPPLASNSGAHWERVHDASKLAAWEAAWRAPHEPASEPPAHAVFLPALLQNERIAILAASLRGSIVAGGIAYQDAGVVGLSNMFLLDGAPPGLRVELLARTVAAFPGLPVVGYEHGDELSTWCALGFETMGPLRVWRKNP